MTQAAAIYARFSSNEQAHTSTLESQIRACKEYAIAHGLSVDPGHIYRDEGIAGSRDRERAGFQAMIADAQAGRFGVVLVWKYSRFFRDRHKSAVYKGLLKQHSVDVVSVSEPVDRESASGVLMEGMIEVIDQFYSARLSEETRRGLRENVLGGYRGGSVAPYGYRRVRVDAGGRDKTVIRPDPETAPVLRRIFEDYAAGRAGFKRLAACLNKEGIRSPRGGTWDPSTIRGILRNEVYIGWGVRRKTRKVLRPNDRLSWERLPPSDWVINEDAHPPLISRETWDVVRSRFGGRRSAPRTRATYLLTGFLRCGVCGGNFTTRKTRQKNGAWYHWYECGIRHRRGHAACSNGFRIPHEPFHSQFREQVIAATFDDDTLAYMASLVRECVVAMQDDIRPRIARLEREDTSIRRRIARLIDAIEDGQYEAVRDRLADLEARAGAIRAELDRLSERRDTEVVEFTAAHFDARRAIVETALSTNDVRELREVLGEWLESVTVHPDGQLEFVIQPAGALGATGETGHNGWCAAPGITHCVPYQEFVSGVAGR